MTFMELCVQGKISADSIDDFVDRWHEGNDDVPLNVYLGMSEMEYNFWVLNPCTLDGLIENRRRYAEGDF